MDPAMLPPRARAQAIWQQAMKQRARVLRGLDRLKKGSSDKFEKEQLKTLEADLSQFRLGFVSTLAQDPTYAFEEDVEDVLWKLHVFVNMAYRELAHTTFRGQEHVVTRRRVERAWISFLNTATEFYITYFQRLQGLYGMPQIARVTRALKLAAPKVGEAQKAQVPSEALQKSFYSTLLHLGDISRWKIKAQSKPSGMKTAVLYYELAHDLNPTSGAAHHQLGILEDDNHLQIVYHLYRAAAVESPHPNAIQNLEQEFRKLSNLSQGSRRAGPVDPNHAFADWFTKLHAYLYKGDEYSPELEEEVLHRLELALKKTDTLSLILKMVLTNIAAYYIAKARIQKQWSLKASSSCQFILRFNVRWIETLCRLLQSGLRDFGKSALPAQNQADSQGLDAKQPERSSAFTETILPLARIYMAWLYIYRTDIVDYQDHLGAYVIDMFRVLASSLTAMANEFNKGVTGPSEYLLAEDFEALGMKPFDDATLAPICSLHHEPEKGCFKRHWEDSHVPRHSLQQEMLNRVHDWMHYGFALALDERFPLSVTSANGAVSVQYYEGGEAAAPIQDPAAMSQDPRPNGRQAANPAPQANENDSGTILVTPRDHASPTDPQPPNSSGRDSPTINDLLEAEPNVGLKARMRSLVDDLLDDDNPSSCPQAQQQGVDGDSRRPSHGTYASRPGQDLGGRPASRLQASVPAFVPGLRPHSGSENIDRHLPQSSVKVGGSSSGFSGSGSSGLPHARQRLGGSTDSSGASPFLSPKGDGHARAASITQRPDGRVDSVSPPIFAFNSSWTRAFDPNASSLPPVMGVPGPQVSGAASQREVSGTYRHHPVAQTLDQYQAIVANGKGYNGSTAYGRGDFATMDDPGYFRNALQQTHMSTALQGADQYDTSVLLSALRGNPSKS
ncbi:hypothetical protein N0V82_001391 [Gnomoniopsis sp. IMI 355080]|nr:hypothetical protein N0V82_001391 [Gnomoniopsis sp. IMI 355080]